MSLLHGFRWFRRWHGGKWELWCMEPSGGSSWYVVEKFSRITGKRPNGGCRGTPIEEDWTK